MVNPVESGCCTANHAEACSFRFAEFRRRVPLLSTCGWSGEPLVKTWQPAGGAGLLAHTFVELNPPVGKLNDCAETGCTAKMLEIKNPATIKPIYTLLRIIISPWATPSDHTTPRAPIRSNGTQVKTMKCTFQNRDALQGGSAGSPAVWTFSKFRWDVSRKNRHPRLRPSCDPFSARGEPAHRATPLPVCQAPSARYCMPIRASDTSGKGLEDCRTARSKLFLILSR